MCKVRQWPGALGQQKTILETLKAGDMEHETPLLQMVLVLGCD